MHGTEPKVFIITAPRIQDHELHAYLDHIGASDWESDAMTDAELLIEVMGRMCYKSFGTDLNKNIVRVRNGNREYIENVVKVAHGSILEHAYVTFIFTDVSRVFTHELVRHRVGVAISQESLRFVRLDDLGMWAPTCIREDKMAMDIFVNTAAFLENIQKTLADHFDLDNPEIPFSKKKVIQSALRRIAPIGLSTTIGWTANFRTLRWVIQERTNRAAEEEIRAVFGQVAKRMIVMYPSVFGDFRSEMVDGYLEYTTENRKV